MSDRGCDAGRFDQRQSGTGTSGEFSREVLHGRTTARPDLYNVRIVGCESGDGAVDERAFFVSVVIGGDIQIRGRRFLLVGKVVR